MSGDYQSGRVYSGKKVVWAIGIIFFLMSVVCSLGTYLAGQAMIPYFRGKDKEAAKRNAMERVKQKESAPDVR